MTKKVFGVCSLGIFTFSFLANVNTSPQLATFGLGTIVFVSVPFVLPLFSRAHWRLGANSADRGEHGRGDDNGEHPDDVANGRVLGGDAESDDGNRQSDVGAEEVAGQHLRAGVG
jgi:hypothetical protein